MSVNDIEARALALRVEDQLAALESVSDPTARVARDAALDAIESLLLLYGEGLARILAAVRQITNPAVASALTAEFARDEVIGHLLLVHDLHPDTVDVRVQRALEDVQEEHRKQRGRVELVDVANDGAKLRIVDAGQGCHSTGAELQRMAEEAVLAAAPELGHVETEIESTDAPPPLVTLVHHRVERIQAAGEARE